MNFAILGVSVTLATLAAVALLLSVSVAVVWRLGVIRARVPADAGAHARLLFRWRALPAVGASVAAFGLVMPAFLAFEPRVGHETPGWPLLLMAAAGGVLVLAGLTRGVLAWQATRALARRWSRDAQPLALEGAPAPARLCGHDFPTVALLGVRRPRLFVSRRALELLDSAELRVVMAHEAGHLAARDPLKTLLLRACPTPLALMSAGEELAGALARASERAADDHATGGDPRRTLDLASALVKIGRLAPRAPEAATALEGKGDALAERVRRLLDQARVAPSRPASAGWLARVGASQRALLVSILLAGLLAGSHDLLRGVHHAVEHVVHYLR